jgi:hypothetical protein
MRPIVVSVGLALVFGANAQAYVLENVIWGVPNPTLYVNLDSSIGQLGAKAPSFPLFDGAISFFDVFDSAVNTWNSYLEGLKIQPVNGYNPAGLFPDNNLSEVGFGSTILGDALGGETLAITAVYYYQGYPNTFAPTDIVFNSKNFNWNSYRGPLNDATMDLRRVGLHELGHFIGLAHPNDYGQVVNAIMNSTIGNTDSLTADDIAGGQSLYGAGSNTSSSITTIARQQDFNGDRRDDLLWFQPGSGTLVEWWMDGSAIGAGAEIGAFPTGWRIIQTGDLAGDGHSSIIFEHPPDFTTGVWVLNGSAVVDDFFLNSPTTPSRVEAVGNFSGLGRMDIVWRDIKTGNVTIDQNEGTFTFAPWVLLSLPLDQVIVGAADLFSDGIDELIVRNSSTGEVGAWRFYNTSFPIFPGEPQYISLGTLDFTWSIQAIGDFNADGKDDLVWRNAVSNQIVIWSTNGTAQPSSTVIGIAPRSWDIIGAPSFYGGKRASLLFRDRITGQPAIWYILNGTLYGTGYLPNPGNSWVPVFR